MDLPSIFYWVFPLTPFDVPTDCPLTSQWLHIDFPVTFHLLPILPLTSFRLPFGFLFTSPWCPIDFPRTSTWLPTYLMGSQWEVDGKSRGGLMGSPWEVYGKSMGNQLKVKRNFPSTCHEASHKPPIDFLLWVRSFWIVTCAWRLLFLALWSYLVRRRQLNVNRLMRGSYVWCCVFFIEQFSLKQQFYSRCMQKQLDRESKV